MQIYIANKGLMSYLSIPIALRTKRILSGLERSLRNLAYTGKYAIFCIWKRKKKAGVHAQKVSTTNDGVGLPQQAGRFAPRLRNAFKHLFGVIKPL